MQRRPWLGTLGVVALLGLATPAFASSGRIPWLLRHDPVGAPVPRALQVPSTSARTLFTRLITIDARQGVGMVVSLHCGARPLPPPSVMLAGAAATTWICFSPVTPTPLGMHCESLGRAFSHGRSLMWGLQGGSGHLLVRGLASDRVQRVTVTLSSGATLDVPLRDDAFVLGITTPATVAQISAYGRGGALLERKAV